eukprot:SAG11_NODE_9744_length_883_cov_4.644133_1_plen_202_part_10
MTASATERRCRQMRMPQLVLCVVFLASCGCGVVEGFDLTNLNVSDEIRNCNDKINNLGPLLERDSAMNRFMDDEQNAACTAKLRGDICDENIIDVCNLEDIYPRENDMDAMVDGWFMDRLIHSSNRVTRRACSSFTDFDSFKTAVIGEDGCGGDFPDDVPAVTKKPPNNTCPYAHDGECDEPMYCGDGTDCSDCGNCATQEV